MYLVSREVLATSIKGAIEGKGVVYSVVLAEDKFQPNPRSQMGFKNKTNGKKKRYSKNTNG